VATMIGCLPTQALGFLAVFVYATQAIAFEWKPGFTPATLVGVSKNTCKHIRQILSILTDFQT